MKSVAIIGGETHLGEVTQLRGEALDIVATSMKDEDRKKALGDVDVPNFADPREMLGKTQPDIAAIANENDLKFGAVMSALEAGCDVIVDKPLCITMEEQRRIEDFLAEHPDRRLINLLTLRGESTWAGLRDTVAGEAIGKVAFVHVRMAVQLKRAERPSWFLDVRRCGGVFLDLLIHGIDQVEWLTGDRVTAMTANTGNLGEPDDAQLRDHAAVYCELAGGGSAVVEGQRMLPGTKAADYRVMMVGTEGLADMDWWPPGLRITNGDGADVEIDDLPEKASVVKDWLAGGGLVPQEASLRANRLAIFATESAEGRCRIEVG
ncbi:MAG: Gfo/Idh/MocA family oxidoreductase [Phycisphaerae bacterium]|nr:Gfo/Idh/MocA family oxidoreductase [Phycisphaerae bacterium]